VHTANSFGEDKLSLNDRAKWCEDHMEELIASAEDPYKNRFWIKGEKPWTVLACAYEFQRLQLWTIVGGNCQSTFESKVPLYIDGSNNGVQHLTALSLDETVAHLVNLVPTDLPGDVYMYVAEKVWEELAILHKETNPELTEASDRLIKEVIAIKLKMGTAETKEDKDKVFKELDTWRKENKELLKGMFVPFWMRLAENKKLQRKTVKRPVMTLGYGVTKMGVREQVFDDTKTLSEELKFKEKGWVNPFGDLLMDTTLKNMPGPAAMLDLFRELAVRANSEEKFLQWDVPVTNFPVVQAYEATKEIQVEAYFCNEGTSRPKFKTRSDGTKVSYSPPKSIRLTIRPYERRKLEKRAQKTGAAPNLVHSFDAAHLTTTIVACPFPVTTIHDSFGCHAGNMDDLFRIVRETFVSFYKSNPLESVLKQVGAEDLTPTKGSLDLYAIMDSDFAFC
jgi:DNA-directed RNA polymerase